MILFNFIITFILLQSYITGMNDKNISRALEGLQITDIDTDISLHAHGYVLLQVQLLELLQTILGAGLWPL